MYNKKTPYPKLLILLMLLFLASLMAEQEVASNIEARVGERIITTEQLSNELSRISQREENDRLSYLQRRELALQTLIHEELLYNYAVERGVTVTGSELDDYFRAVYGDHERVTTDGEFDDRKYQELKRRPEIRRLLNDLRRDLMIDKAEAIVRNMFQYSESNLIDRFFLENTELDLSYVLMDKEDISIPFLVDPMEAYDYFEANSYQYDSVRELNISFFVVPFELMREKAASMEITSEHVEQYIDTAGVDLINELLLELNASLPLDSIDVYIDKDRELRTFLHNQDSLKVFNEISKRITAERVNELAYLEAQNSVSRIQSRLSVDYEMITLSIADSPHDRLNPPLFRKSTLLPMIARLEVGEYSQPLKIDYGYMVAVINEDLNNNFKLPPNLARQVWQDFVRFERISRQETELRELYALGLDDYTVPAIYVTRVVVDKKEIFDKEIGNDELYRFYRQNYSLIGQDEEAISFEDLRPEIKEQYFEIKIDEVNDWVEQHIYEIGRELLQVDSNRYLPGVEASNQLVYLESLPNTDHINDLIKEDMEAMPQTGVQSLDNEDYLVYYIVNSWFTEYLAGYSELKGYLYRRWTEEIDVSEADYKEYYEAHQRHFVSADSLRLAGLFFPWQDFVEPVTEAELRNYYGERQDHLFTEHQAVIEYVRVYDPELAKRGLINELKTWIEDGIDLPLLQSTIGSKSIVLDSAQDYSKRYLMDNGLSKGQLVVANSLLPGKLADELEKLSRSETSGTFYYNDSWYFLKKIRGLEPEKASYLDMRWILREELIRERAESKAHQLATNAFVDVTSVKGLDFYPDTLFVFTTEKKNANSEFGPLGDITGYRPRLLSLRRNERLNTIYANEDGFGIVFCLEKTLGHPMDFEEAFDDVRESLHADLRTENAFNYGRYLRSLVISGVDPHELLIFWGGWHIESNLTFNGTIPGVKYSRQIIENAAQGSEGDVSHIIRNREGEYLFYRLDRKEGVSMECYTREKDEFRETVFRTDFERWLNDYGHRIGIEIF